MKFACLRSVCDTVSVLNLTCLQYDIGFSHSCYLAISPIFFVTLDKKEQHVWFT